MKTQLFYSTLLAAALSVTALGADDKTIGEKTTDTLQKAGEKTKEAGKAVVNETKKAVEAVKDAVTPDSDARRVDVTLEDKRVELPKQIPAGKTAFVVKNSAGMKQNFRIRGEGVDKRFMMDVDPNDSKTLNIDLKPGTYKVHVPDTNGPEATLQVK
jgi:hypothetical protein